MKREKINSLWVEKYRPDTLDNFVGSDDIKNKIKSYLQQNDIPHLLFAGKAGTGKTTLAKIIKDNIDCDSLYINASDKGGVDFIRTDIIPFASSMGFKSSKIVVLDEFDYSSPQFQAALRNTMETFSKTTRFILTCNHIERIIEPIRSRCQVFRIYPPSKKDIALRIVEILKTENITFNIEDIALIIDSHYPDIRQCINTCQKNSMNNELLIDKEATIESDYKLKLLELLKMHSKKDAYKSIRQLLLDNGLRDYSEIYTLLYEKVDEFAKGKTAEVILAIANSQYQDAFVIDKEINFAAACIEILKIIHS